jgi:hypothetical protein
VASIMDALSLTFFICVSPAGAAFPFTKRE